MVTAIEQARRRAYDLTIRQLMRQAQRSRSVRNNPLDSAAGAPLTADDDALIARNVYHLLALPEPPAETHRHRRTLSNAERRLGERS